MDGCKSEQRLCKLADVVDTIRPPLVPGEKNNAVLNTRHPQTKEVSSSYKAPTPSTSSVNRRFPSPNPTRATPTPFQVVQKRAVSAERKRPSTPPSHQNPSTPVNDASTSMPISSRRLSTDRMPESLWPSTMRSHSVSFQSDDISIPVSKKEKEKSVSNVSLDRTLTPPSNVAHKQQSETSTLSRKPSPERKRNLLEGKNAHDQSENAKPVDDLPSQLIDHHRWPSRIDSVSFQFDDISVPVSKKEKEKFVSKVSLDRTLTPPSNVAHKQQSETSTLSQKPSPERKRNLLEGKNAHDQSENAKPVDDLPSRLIDHHRWPSRIDSVSFQSDDISIPVGKKEKEKSVSKVSLDRTLTPPSNVAHKQQSETSTLSRKPSPERKRNLLEGKNAHDQSENAKPVDDLPSRLIDHHRWPSRIDSVSFQSDDISIPVSKKEKEKSVSKVSLDRTLTPPSNVAHKQQSETSTLSRKPSPERKRNLLEGKNAHDQSENAKPVDDLPSRLIDHHRWPSRIDSVSFQSDDISIPVSKKEKEKSVSKVSLDRTLTPPSNVAHKQQSETSTLSRKPSPERKRNLLEGKNAHDQSENAKPVDDLPSRLIDHHRWPSRIGGKLSSNLLNKSVDLGDKIVKKLSTLIPGTVSSLKCMPMSDNLGKALQKSSGNAQRLLSHEEIGQVRSEAILINEKPLRTTVTTGILCASSLEKSTLATSGSRFQSPSRTSVSRGISPYPARPSSPPPRGVSPTPRRVSLPPREVSPTRIRTPIPSSQSQSSASVLSSTSRGVSPTPRVVSPTHMRTSSLSSQSHSSTSVISSTPRGVSPTPTVVSPTRMRASTLSSQSHSSSLTGVSPTPRVISPPRMRTTSLSQSHSSTPRGVNPTPSLVSPTRSSTSVISSTPRGVSPTRMRASTLSSQSHSSSPVLSSTLMGVSPTPRVISPTRMRTSTTLSQSHNSTSVSSTPRGVSPTPSVVSPTRMRISTSLGQSYSSTSVISSTPTGVIPTPRVVSPTRMRTSTSSSRSHSSTSVLISTPSGVSPTSRVVSPIRMRTSSLSSQSHSSTSVICSTPRGVSPTTRVVSPTRMGTSTSSGQSDSSTSVISSAPRGVSPTLKVIISTPRGVSPTPRVVSPTRMSISTSLSQSHSSTSVISSTPRGVSPSPRVVSPTRMRTSTSSSQSHTSTPVISFITDFEKGRKSESFIDDAHQLRLLNNRFLQWRYANAHSEAVLYIQKVNAEETSYNVWNATLSLWDALIKKRINLQRLKLELKLNSILNDQMGYLKDWAFLGRDHIRCLAGAVEGLKATTLHLPVTDGARADTESLKAAICSVVDVMRAMGSSICSLVPKVEEVSKWACELAAIAAQEQNMLDQCEALLASTADLQLEEYSLRSHLIQTKQPLKKNKQPVLGTKTFPWP